MLCLTLDDHDLDHNCHQQNQASVSSSINNNNNGFILPINFASSIHRYLWKKARSFSSGDGFLVSSNFEVSKLQDETQGEKCFYKCQLEQDVKQLQQQLQEETDFRLALESAVEHSDSTLSNATCLLPDKAQDLLDSIAVLDMTVSKLEQEIEALQCQLSQERNEHHLAEYRLWHLSCPASSLFNCSPARLTELVRIFRPENVTELLKESLRDYVQASVGISNKGKLLIPKLLHCFVKGIVDDSVLPYWICQFLSQEQAAVVEGCSSHPKWSLLGARGFSVLPYDSRFRYLFLMEPRNQ